MKYKHILKLLDTARDADYRQWQTLVAKQGRYRALALRETARAEALEAEVQAGRERIAALENAAAGCLACPERSQAEMRASSLESEVTRLTGELAAAREFWRERRLSAENERDQLRKSLEDVTAQRDEARQERAYSAAREQDRAETDRTAADLYEAALADVEHYRQKAAELHVALERAEGRMEKPEARAADTERFIALGRAVEAMPANSRLGRNAIGWWLSRQCAHFDEEISGMDSALAALHAAGIGQEEPTP